MLNLETYCIKCKRNSTMINTHFQRLASYKVIINGKCSMCGSNLFKGKVFPKPSVNKKIIKMKREISKKNKKVRVLV